MPEPTKQDDLFQALKRAGDKQQPSAESAVPTSLPERTQLALDAPAPRLSDMILEAGQTETAQALIAWDMRINGQSISDIAHTFGLSLTAAKRLIREAHEAISEDLKENLAQNRSLDLERIDGLINTYYPAAKAGSVKAALVTLKALERRAKLTGAEPDLTMQKANPQNVLVWIQNQLPSINRIVDALPVEVAPGAPTS